MKKLILAVAMLALIGCSKQDFSNQSHAEKSLIQDAEIANALDFVQTQKVAANTYIDADPAVQLDVLKFVAIVRTLYPSYGISNAVANEGVFQFTASKNEQFNSFHRSENWTSIKIIKNKMDNDVSHMTVELYSKRSYVESKQAAFDLCKRIWSGIDQRVPTVIDELAHRLDNGKENSAKERVEHIRYGYLFDLDASHYRDGYPVSCTIAYDKINGSPSA